MVVTIKNLYSESRSVIKSVINENVVDPNRGKTNSNRRWIYREFPDTTSHSFSGYPIIVLSSADLGDDVITLNQLFRDNIFTFNIEIYTKFVDKNARVDDISDQIAYALIKQSSQNEMSDKGLVNPKITSSPYENMNIDGTELSARLIIVEFSTELCF